MTKYRIRVTQEDIENGKKRSMIECPIALAMTRKFGVPISVTTCDYYRREDLHPTTKPLPRSVLMFIQRFDVGYEVEPFTFTIEV